MIEKRTVLILGAGASVDSGYPLGSGLKSMIIKNAEIHPLWKNRLESMPSYVDEQAVLIEPLDKIAFLVKNCGFSVKQINCFRDDFMTSPKSSIDAFLENRPEFMELGKMLISMTILGCENYRLISNKENQNNWYNYLFNIMTSASSWEIFKNNKVKVITYNYDRSLEMFFVSALKATFGKSEEECVEMFTKTIQVIHVHGQLASIDIKAKPYHTDIVGGYVKEGAKQLKIIHEGDDITKTYGPAKYALEKADQIFVLGFGFDQRNLTRLALEDYQAPIYATRTGITNLNVSRINELACQSILFSPTSGNGIVEFFENEVSLYGHVAPHMPKKNKFPGPE